MSRIPNPLGDSSRESRKPPVTFDDVLIFLMILPTVLAAFISLVNSLKVPEVPEVPEARDILLTVPETSRVDAQVTSDNNTVNIQNL